jgi:xanthine dehydrogenase accessory factor
MPASHGLIERLAELSASGVPLVSVTLAATVGSTPSEAGSKMLVTAAGLDRGTVGGGRVEAMAIERAQRMLEGPPVAAPRAELVEWNLQRDVGMTCGGVVTLLFELYNHGLWQVAVFGAGHVAAAVIHCLLPLECRISCIDPRPEWLARLPEHPRLTKVAAERPELHAATLPAESFILCMTMGHRTDRPILEAVFQRECAFPYIGAIGSRAKRAVLERELRAAGVRPEQLEALRCPMGLPVGSNLPGEIAISVAAELLAVRDAWRTKQPSLGMISRDALASGWEISRDALASG